MPQQTRLLTLTANLAGAECAKKENEHIDFFPKYERNYDPPRSICSKCPVKFSCLKMALDENLGFGMYGGYTPRERAQYLRKSNE